MSNSEVIGVDAIQSYMVRESLLRVLSAAAFLVFFQSYLVAPLVPALATEFQRTLGPTRSHRSSIYVAIRILDPFLRSDLGQDRAKTDHPQFVGDHGAHHRWHRDSS